MIISVGIRDASKKMKKERSVLTEKASSRMMVRDIVRVMKREGLAFIHLIFVPINIMALEIHSVSMINGTLKVSTVREALREMEVPIGENRCVDIIKVRMGRIIYEASHDWAMIRTTIGRISAIMGDVRGAASATPTLLRLISLNWKVR